MEALQEKFESFAIVEIMGHTKIAGMATAMQFGNTVMLRVDVPETSKQPAFSKMYGMSSIFSISPVDEVTAKAHAEALEVKPIMVWEVERSIDKRVQEGIRKGVDERILHLNPVSNDQPKNVTKVIMNAEQVIVYQRIKENVIDFWYGNQIEEGCIDDELEVILLVSKCENYEEVLDKFEGLTVQQVAENDFLG